MPYWFGMLHLNQDEPTLYGPFNTEELADKKQQELWAYRKKGEHISVVYSATDDESARNDFLFSSITR